MPVTWMQKLAADHLVEHGVLQRFRVKESLRSPYKALNCAYRTTEAGERFFEAVEDCMLPQHVAVWYRSAMSLLRVLDDHMAELRDEHGSSTPTEIVMELLRTAMREGRDMLANRNLGIPGSEPTVIESRCG
jgi:hypothetical protein